MANLQDILTLSQSNRLLKLKSPLGEKDLLLDWLSGEELVSSPFRFELGLISSKGDLELKGLVGQPAEVTMVTSSRGERYFHGYLASFSHQGSDGGLSTYHATLVPWLYFLGIRINCRIFQSQNVLDIVRAIFKDYGATADFEVSTRGSYPELPLTVQYNESDLAFVSRLLETHGIFYYFRFQAGRHTMIICDGNANAPDMPGQKTISFNSEAGPGHEDSISAWNAHRHIIANQYAVKTYDFVNPADPMSAKTKTAHKLGKQPDLEIYEHLGSFTYKDYDESVKYADMRMEELELQSKAFTGAGNVRTLTCGHIFELKGHFAVGTGEDALFFVLQVEHHASNNYQAGGESHYANTFTCIRKAIPYRPGRRTPRPIMHGPQTAIVVGPKGEEIFCDKYGRVKVQFHWDREGKTDDKSSCWVRVSSQWAGGKMGMVSIPRVKTEVLVDFLEGDPDRPIITGAVYNAQNMPPWSLPDNKTQSGIYSNSTPKGGYDNANALRFEDKKGEEEVWLHAEKDQRIEVENDESHWVGHDRKKNVDNDETTTVGNNRTESVGVNEDITIGSSRMEKVGSNEDITIGANRTEIVGANETITIGGNQSITILQTKSESVVLMSTEQVGLARNLTVGAAYTIEVGAAMNTAVALSQTEQVGMDQSVDVGKNQNISVGKKIHITAGDELSISVGQSKFVMKKDGTITINGKTLKVETTSDQTYNAKGNLVQKGQKIMGN